MTGRTVRFLLFLPLLFLAVGCASYSDRVADLRPELMQRDFDAALQTIEKGRQGNAMLLYHLERALVLHYAGRWQESNTVLATAERLAEELYTQSISQGVFSLMTSDNTIDYRADAFEMAMIPYYRALNYIYLDEREDALVEARKASLYLSRFEDSELAADEGLADLRDLLRKNAFLQYFSAMLYEWDGEVNDAWIAYRHAAGAYRAAAGALDVQTPPWLGADLTRCAGYLGFSVELEEMQQEFPDLFPASRSASGPTGEVVLLLEIGFVAHKVEDKFDLPILVDDKFTDDDDFSLVLADRHRNEVVYAKKKVAYWLSVAMPRLSGEPGLFGNARVSAGIAGAHATSCRVEDLSGRARITFQSRQGAVLLKTIARGLTKYQTWKVAQKEGKALGIMANLFNAATETADTRSWITLPDGIAMVRLSLPPGTYDLRVDLIDRVGALMSSETVPGVTVRAGDWSFISRRVF